MHGPTLTFGFVFATLLGAGFHLIVGGNASRLGLYFLVGWAGFTLGHFLGASLNINLFNIGALHFFSAVITAIICLILSRMITNNRSSRRTIR